MAGREKVTARKLKNMEMEEIAEASDIVSKLAKDASELALGDEFESMAHALGDLSANEFLVNTIGKQRLLVTILQNKAILTANELKARQVPAALKYAAESLRETQGDASQHVQQVKRGFTPEQMEQIIKSIPKDVSDE